MHRFMSELFDHGFVGPGGQAQSDLAEENVCWLIGWLGEHEALQVLSAGRYGAGPFPVPAELQVKAQAAREAVAARAPFEPQSAILPHAEGDSLLAEIAARQDIQAAFPGASWRPQYVDLSKVIVLQKMVVTDGLDERVTGITEGSPELLELCLPTQQQPFPIDITTDADGRAATISSLNPNLRVQGFQANLGPTGGSITFIVGPGSPYVTVVELGGRFFLRDGHHRAAALMAAGITAAPVVVVTGTSYADAAMVPGLFGPAVALGDRPPMVADFLDEGVSAAAVRRPLRKITRISASEFPVARLSRSSALAGLAPGHSAG
jgi:hypothetical protein